MVKVDLISVGVIEVSRRSNCWCRRSCRSLLSRIGIVDWCGWGCLMLIASKMAIFLGSHLVAQTQVVFVVLILWHLVNMRVFWFGYYKLREY